DVDFYHHDGAQEHQAAIRKDHITVLDQIWDNVLTYEESFGLHNLTVMGGYSYRSESGDELYAKGSGFSIAPQRGAEQYWYLFHGESFEGVGDADVGDENVNNYGKYYGTSYFGGIAYNFDDRYLVYGTFRRDGTSK